MEKLLIQRNVGTVLIGLGATILGGIGAGILVAGILILIPVIIKFMVENL